MSVTTSVCRSEMSAMSYDEKVRSIWRHAERAVADSTALDFISTHPSTAERVKQAAPLIHYIEAAERHYYFYGRRAPESSRPGESPKRPGMPWSPLT